MYKEATGTHKVQSNPKDIRSFQEETKGELGIRALQTSPGIVWKPVGSIRCLRQTSGFQRVPGEVPKGDMSS